MPDLLPFLRFSDYVDAFSVLYSVMVAKKTVKSYRIERTFCGICSVNPSIAPIGAIAEACLLQPHILSSYIAIASIFVANLTKFSSDDGRRHVTS